jgi:three-Cys-motif partner protein
MSRDHRKCPGGLCFDEIGYWSEVKLDIVRKYAEAYTKILARQRFQFAYIDGFAGAGLHLAKRTKGFVPGSPLNALRIQPRFHEYFLVDLDGDRVDQLREFPEVKGRPEVHVVQGNCNQVLLRDIFPKVRYEDYRRALCVLDPYGLHLDWEVIQMAGKMKSIDMFLNFPIMDANRNALWHKAEAASPEGRARMTAYWGDESWRDAAYLKQGTLFGDEEDIKRGNRAVVDAFAARLKSVAGFDYVPEPMPMRNSTNAVVYYLFFASPKAAASNIFRDIVNKFRNRGGSGGQVLD